MSPIPVAARPIDGWVIRPGISDCPSRIRCCESYRGCRVTVANHFAHRLFNLCCRVDGNSNVLEGPSQVFDPFSKCGVTTMEATTGAVPAFIALNDVMFPVPLAASPIVVWSLVHVYVSVPPVLGVVNVTASVGALLHTTLFDGCLTSAVGLTVIVNVFVCPSHVIAPFLKCGVMAILATTWPFVLFIAVNDGMFPVPVAARPIEGWSLVHVKVIVPLVRVLVVM